MRAVLTRNVPAWLVRPGGEVRKDYMADAGEVGWVYEDDDRPGIYLFVSDGQHGRILASLRRGWFKGEK